MCPPPAPGAVSHVRVPSSRPTKAANGIERVLPLGPDTQRHNYIIMNMPAHPSGTRSKSPPPQTPSTYLYDWEADRPSSTTLPVTGRAPAMLEPIHTSEFGYIFGNLSLYSTTRPTEYTLDSRSSDQAAVHVPQHRQPKPQEATTPSRDSHRWTCSSWAARTKGPSAIGRTLVRLTMQSVRRQRLRERCGLLNAPEMKEQPTLKILRTLASYTRCCNRNEMMMNEGAY